MAKPAEKASSRRFSKRMLILNVALAWGAVFYAIANGQASAVAASGLGLIGVLYGAYTGIGHLDYRRVTDLVARGVTSISALDGGPMDGGGPGMAG